MKIVESELVREVSPADTELRDRRPKGRAWMSRNWGLLFALGASTLVFLTLHPSLLLSATTTAGGDTGAHFIVPYFAKREFFSHFSLTGWSSIWYDGFPLFTFYFPLPSLVVAFLSYVIPYDIAFKLVTVSGSLALPLVSYYLGRAGRLKEPYPTLMALASLAYLFDRTYTIDGGNIASTLAGEYAFSFSLALGIWFLALVLKGLDSPRRLAGAAFLYGLTALSHLLPAFFVAALAIVYVLTGKKIAELVRLGVAGLLGVGVIALWLVPFAANIGYTTSMGWTKVTTYIQSLAPDPLRPWIYLALLGAVLTIYRRRRLGITLTIAGTVSAVAFVVFPQGAVYNARMLPFYVLCVYFLAASAVAEVALLIPDIAAALRFGFLGSGAEGREGDPSTVPRSKKYVGKVGLDLLRSLEDDSPTLDHGASVSPRARKIGPNILGVGTFSAFLFIGVLPPLVALPPWLSPHVQASFVPSWAAWNYSGYEAKPGWSEYKSIMGTMGKVGLQHGCGRAMWEYSSTQNQFGTPMALMLLPYWTHGCIDSMEGLFFESSATTPYHFLNQSELSAVPSDAMSGLPYAGLNVNLGVRHLQMLGVRYYMAFSPQVKLEASLDPNLRLITVVPAVVPGSTDSVLGQTWNIYQVKGSSLVQPLARNPVVWRGLRDAKPSWLRYSVAWYQNPKVWSTERAQNGPKSWKRIRPGASAPSQPALPRTTVSGVKEGNSTLNFHVSRTGVPVLVKISYFPNWKAIGAAGPYRVAPNLIVVIPRSKNVSLVYTSTALDTETKAVSVFLAFGLLAVIFIPKRILPSSFIKRL